MSSSDDRLSELRLDRSGEDEARPWPRRIALLATALVLVALAWWWFVARGRGIEVAVAAVTAERASGDDGVSVLDASGYVTARRQATVSAKTTGKIIEVLVEEGLAVAEGQVLARLDDSLVRRQLALTEARLGAERSNLREIEVRLVEARTNLRRVRDLVRSGVDSEARLDAAAAEHDSLEARLAAGGDVVVVAEREVALRRQELEDTLIRAPFDGVAISKDAQPGEMISPVSAGGGFTRTGVSTIVDMGSLEIEVDVNEAYINRVRSGQRVVATLDAYPDWKIPAHVITTIPAADRQKATVRVRIGFDELGDPRLLPDMGVKVSFRDEEASPGASEVSAERERLLVPTAALRRAQGQDLLFVLRGDGTVERRAVSLGAELEGRREVTAGVRAGERVVVEPPAELDDGSRVRVRE